MPQFRRVGRTDVDDESVGKRCQCTHDFDIVIGGAVERRFLVLAEADEKRNGPFRQCSQPLLDGDSTTAR
ncbi:MAG: hypothetical protein ABMB14_03195, partial [Myxococcota bacterium]